MKARIVMLLISALLATINVGATDYNFSFTTGANYNWIDAATWSPAAPQDVGPSSADSLVLDSVLGGNATIQYGSAARSIRSITTTTMNHKNVILNRNVAGGYLQFSTTTPSISSAIYSSGVQLELKNLLFQSDSTLTIGGSGRISVNLVDSASIASWNSALLSVTSSDYCLLRLQAGGTLAAPLVLPTMALSTGNSRLFINTHTLLDGRSVSTGTGEICIGGNAGLTLTNGATLSCGNLVMASGNSLWNYGNGAPSLTLESEATMNITSHNVGDQNTADSTTTITLKSGTLSNSGGGFMGGFPNHATGTKTQTHYLYVQGGTYNFTKSDVNFDFSAIQATRTVNAGLVSKAIISGTVGIDSGILNLGSRARLVLGTDTARLQPVAGTYTDPGDTVQATLQLNGGELRTAREIYRGANTYMTGGDFAKIYLNGGTIKATANIADLFVNYALLAADGVYASAGHARIDSNGFDMGIKGNVLNDGGGLVKLGAGTLTLSGTNTYTGTTTVEAGKLIVTTESTDFGGYEVSNSAILQVNTTSGQTLNAASLTLAGGSVLDLRNISSTTVPALTISGAVTVAGTTTINVTGTTFAPGDYPLLQYGTLEGTGVIAFGELPYGVTGAFMTNTTTKVIYLAVASVADPLTWKGLENAAWDINTATNWANSVATGIKYLEGDMVRFDDTATGSTTLTLDATVNPGGILFANVTKNYTLAGTGGISGSAIVDKVGTGTAIFATDNTYSGQTLIREGTLQIGSGGTVGSLGTGAVANNATLTYNRSDAQSWNQNISGTGLLDKQGAATLTLTGTNTYGNTTVNAGSLQVGNGGTSGTLGTGTVTLNGTSTLTYNRSDDQTWNQALTGTGKLSKQGAGTLTLTAANGFSGGTTIQQGTLELNGGDNRLAVAGAVSFSATGKWDLGGNSQQTGNFTLSNVGYESFVTNGALRVVGNVPFNMNPGATEINLTTTLDLSGLDTFMYTAPSQTMTVGGGGPNANTMVVKLAHAMNTITAYYLNLTQGGGTGNWPFNKGILLLGQENTLNLGNGTGNAIFMCGYRNSGSMIGFLPGLDQPTFKLRASDGVSRAGDIVVCQGSAGTVNKIVGSIDFGCADVMADELILADNVQANSGVNVSGTVTNSAGTVDLTGIVLGRVYTGTAPSNINTLEGAYTQNGGTVSVQTLTFGNVICPSNPTNILPQFVSTYHLNNGTLKPLNMNVNPSGLAFRGTSERNLNWSNGTIKNYDSATDLTVNGTTNAGGVLNVNLLSTGLHCFDAEASRSITVEPLALISGTGTLTKEGLGVLTLNGANTYSGDTVVTNGTLLANNTTGSATGSGALSVCSGATLGGVGTVGGLVNVLQGGRLTPGTNSMAITLNCNGLTLAAGSKWTINHTGSANNSMIVTGALTVQGANEVDLNFTGDTPPVHTILATFTGSFTGLDKLSGWTVNGYDQNLFKSAIKVVGNSLVMVTTRPGTLITFR